MTRIISEFNKFTPYIFDHLTISNVIRGAYLHMDNICNVSTAKIWADHFVFPREVVHRDLTALKNHNFSLESLARERQSEVSETRLNIKRVSDMNVKSEWSNILITLCDGVPILTPTEFICNNIPPPIRNKYLMVRSTVNKLVYAQYVLKNVIIIPTTFAVKLPGIHFSNLHWTALFEKESGRILADPSKGDNP